MKWKFERQNQIGILLDICFDPEANQPFHIFSLKMLDQEFFHHFSSTLCKRVIIKTNSATNGNLKEKKLEKSESCHAWLERRKFGVNLTDLFDGDCSENIECLTIKKQIFVDKCEIAKLFRHSSHFNLSTSFCGKRTLELPEQIS